MTRHAYIDGDPTNPGHIYFEQDGARLRCELEPDDVIAALDAHTEHTGIVDAMAQEIENLRAELDGREKVELPPGWSDAWLGWHGAECSPLPGDTMVQDHDDGHCRLASAVTWTHVRRFRYQGGWLPRGKFIPPAELWDEGCPVRVEFAEQKGDKFECGIPRGHGTHIRLVARQPQAGLPEGFEIRDDGVLVEKAGVALLWPALAKKYGPAAIRQAVDAWLREMGDE